MSKIKRVREIKIEVEKVRVITNLNKVKIYCPICEQKTDFIKPVLAAQMFQTTEEDIHELAKKNPIHITAEENGEFLVCLRCLLEIRENL